LLSAFGPITAIDLIALLNGKTFSSFFKSTMLSRADRWATR
jgi:hypothetical protein